MVYPGIDKIKEQLIFRSLGGLESRQRVGCGFMHKDGIRIDEKDTRLSTYALVYVIRGEGEYVDEDGNRYPLKAGSLFQRIPERNHSTILDPGSRWAECFIDLGAELYRALVAMRIVEPDKYVYWLPPDKGLEKEFYHYKRSLETVKERELSLFGLEMLQFCASILQRAKSEAGDPLWIMVEKSCRDLSGRCAERFDLKEYCRENGWGYESFRKAFVRRMGISPGQYLIQRRMDEACRLLRTGRLTVKEIALQLGYHSPYEFSAQFRRITGWSPSAYKGAGQTKPGPDTPFG